ncbi:MAG: hypothetical protein ABJP90_12100 [Paracoccaceae bacterium]
MAVALNAAMQPHQTYPSYTAQHFRKVEVGSFDEAADGASVASPTPSAKKMLAA